MLLSVFYKSQCLICYVGAGALIYIVSLRFTYLLYRYQVRKLSPVLRSPCILTTISGKDWTGKQGRLWSRPNNVGT